MKKKYVLLFLLYFVWVEISLFLFLPFLSIHFFPSTFFSLSLLDSCYCFKKQNLLLFFLIFFFKKSLWYFGFFSVLLILSNVMFYNEHDIDTHGLFIKKVLFLVLTFLFTFNLMFLLQWQGIHYFFFKNIFFFFINLIYVIICHKYKKIYSNSHLVSLPFFICKQMNFFEKRWKKRGREIEKKNNTEV